MPRIQGARERYGKTFYDTHVLKPGSRISFFAACDPGKGVFATNMLQRGSLPGDQTFVVNALGVRLIGKTKKQEDPLLDFLYLRFVLGDKPYEDILGPQASLLRTFSDEELGAFERIADEPPPNVPSKEEFKSMIEGDEKEADQIASTFLESLRPHPLSMSKVGYHLTRQLIIPVRQHFYVEVTTSPQMPEPVAARVHLFGLHTRNFQ